MIIRVSFGARKSGALGVHALYRREYTVDEAPADLDGVLSLLYQEYEHVRVYQVLFDDRKVYSFNPFITGGCKDDKGSTVFK